VEVAHPGLHLSCRYCFQGPRPQGRIPEANPRAAIEAPILAQPEVTHFHGGEPLLVVRSGPLSSTRRARLAAHGCVST
jgi:hypothetical protein